MPKALKPTLRERNRYLVFEIISEGVFERKQVVDAIWSLLLRLYGEVGVSKTSLWVMDWNKKKRRGILKVNHKSVGILRASIILVEEIGGGRVIVNVLRTTGTLKKARELL